MKSVVESCENLLYLYSITGRHFPVYKRLLPFIFVVQRPLLAQSLLIITASRSHSVTRHSVGLLCTNDRSHSVTRHSVGLLCTNDRSHSVTPHSVGLLCTNDRSHSVTRHSVGLLCTNDQPDAEISTGSTQNSQETDIQTDGGIRTRNYSKTAAGDPRL